jgi:hypothetical protein
MVQRMAFRCVASKVRHLAPGVIAAVGLNRAGIVTAVTFGRIAVHLWRINRTRAKPENIASPVRLDSVGPGFARLIFRSQGPGNLPGFNSSKALIRAVYTIKLHYGGRDER